MTSMPQVFSPPQLVAVAAGRTDVGRRRSHNEDQVLLVDELGLYAVADGMGGHQAGDVASSIAAASLEQFFDGDSDPAEVIATDEDLADGARRLVAAIHHCNNEVFAGSGRSATRGGMGSTIVAMYVSYQEQLVHIAHVGDSRCYRIRDNEIEQLTKDHSMINEALRLNPDLSDDILAQLPKNVVTRALGTKELVEPDVQSEDLVSGDLYLLCSDGLSGEVSDQDLLFGVLESEQPDDACELLVAMANEAGGRDNISALLVRITDIDADHHDEQPLVVIDDTGPPDSDVGLHGASGDLVDVDDHDELPPPPPHDATPTDDHSAPRQRQQGLSALEPPFGSLATVNERTLALETPPSLQDDHPYAEVTVSARRHSGDSVRAPAFAIVGVGRMRSAPPPPLSGPCCDECGHHLRADERFCGSCGNAIEDFDPNVLCCDACGSEVLLDTRYCIECGVRHGF